MTNHYNDLFELYREGVIICRKGKIIYVNSAAKKILPESFESRGMESVFPEFILNYKGDKFSTVVEIVDEKYPVSVAKLGDDKVFTLYPGEMDGDKKICEFLGTITEELKSTLSVMHLAQDALKPFFEKSGDPKAERYLAMMLHSTYVATRVADNVSFLQKIACGDKEKNVSSFDMVELCGDIAGTVNHFTEKMDLNIVFKCKESCIIFAGDKEKIEKLILNLLSNSIKYSGKKDTVEITLSKIDSGVVITVLDHGSGIKSQDLFTSFSKYMEKRDLSDSKAGSGIGLAIVEYIARLHGGNAVLESVYGSGTKVSVMMKSENVNLFKEQHEDYNSGGMENILKEISDVLDYKAYMMKYTD